MLGHDVRHCTGNSFKFGNVTACVVWCLWHFAAPTCSHFFFCDFALPYMNTASRLLPYCLLMLYAVFAVQNYVLPACIFNTLYKTLPS